MDTEGPAEPQAFIRNCPASGLIYQLFMNLDTPVFRSKTDARLSIVTLPSVQITGTDYDARRKTIAGHQAVTHKAYSTLSV